MSNPQAKKFRKNLHLLVPVCTEMYNDASLTNRWLEIAERYKEVYDFLESREHFNRDKICEFQLVADEFCDLYFAECGTDGNTNYFHLLSTGHFAWFLDRFGNLYR